MKFAFSLILSFFITASVFALEAPENLSSTYIDDTKAVLNWDSVENSIGYYIYYGTSTGVDGGYETEWVDLITETNYELNTLSPETQYFISLTSVDVTGNESVFADELSVTTLREGKKPVINNSLKLISIQEESSQVVALEFSKSLEDGEWVSREFILLAWETGEEILIEDTLLDESKNILKLMLASDLEVNTEYEITVLNIIAEDGATIEEGIDGFWSFTTAEVFVEEELPELYAATEEELTLEENTVSEVWVEEVFENFESTATSENEALSTLEVASELETLPDTGAEHLLLILIAAFGGLGLYARKRRK